MKREIEVDSLEQMCDLMCGGVEVDEIMRERIENNRKCDNWEESATCIICPYCGESYEVELGDTYVGNQMVDEYADGEEVLRCPTCGEEFRLLKKRTIRYITEVM